MITTMEDEKKKPVTPATVPAVEQAAEPQKQPAQQGAEANMATPFVGRHSERFSATIPNMLSERMAGATARMDAANQQYQLAAERYRNGLRNPLADIVLAKQKPTRNVDEEARLRQNAKLQALNNMVSLIGKGVAATGGIRPTPVDNRPIYDIQNRLQRLDDIYRQEGMRFDQNNLASAIRKDQTTQAETQAEMSAAVAAQKAAQDEIDRLGDSTFEWGLSEEDRAFQAAQQVGKQAFDAQQNAQRNRTTLTAASIRSNGKTGSGKEDKPLYKVNLFGKPAGVTTELRADVLNWGRRNGFETQINDVGNILGTNSLQEQQLMQQILPRYENYIRKQDSKYSAILNSLPPNIGSLTAEQAGAALSRFNPGFAGINPDLPEFIDALSHRGISVYEAE